MRLWLDDEYETRKSWFPAENGWTHCRWPAEVIEHLKAGNVEVVSLDHDLGEGVGFTNPRTGYDVVVWLENEIGCGRWGHPLPRILIHSRNVVGRRRIAAAIRNLTRMYESKTAKA